MTEKDVKSVAIVPSAGIGRRMGGQIKKKNYLELRGVPVLAHTLLVLDESPVIDSIVIVCTLGDEKFCKEEIVEGYSIRKVESIVAGGATRQDSVISGFNAILSEAPVVVVHDGARPLVTADIIERTVKTAASHGAAVAAVPVKDTIKEVSGGIITRTVARERLYSIQTPQAFMRGVLLKAHKRAAQDGFYGTDEASLVERLGADVAVVEGSYENIKITTPEDIAVAVSILNRRDEA